MEGRVVPGQGGKGGFFCGSACRASYDGVALGVVVGRTDHVTGNGGRDRLWWGDGRVDRGAV